LLRDNKYLPLENNKKEKEDYTMEKLPPITFQAKVIVPILKEPAFFSNWYKHFKPNSDKAISALLSLKTEDFPLRDYSIKNLKISTSKNHNKEFIKLIWTLDITLTKFDYYDMDGNPITNIPLEERVSSHKDYAAICFAENILWFIVASNIAQPGVLRTRELEVWVGKKLVEKKDKVFGYLSSVVESAGEKSWPKLETLSILATWQWMRQFIPLSDSLGKSNVERAINAFTHLLSEGQDEGRDLIDLMWTMVGLESIYGRGTNDLTFQLVEKAGVFLGKHPGFDKDVKEMYRFRSLFVHGKAQFPSAFFTSDALPEYTRHSSEASDASHLSSALLLATLQQMAKRNLNELNFSFTLNDHLPDHTKP